MPIEVRNTLKDNGLLVAVAVAHGVVIRPSSERLTAALDQLVAQRQGEEFSPDIKDAVRGLLKAGGFKPSGRNKPASEYLAQAAREARFPIINNLVDVNNLISLTTGLPISLLDGSAVGDCLLLRFGRDGEKYVFNSGGQEIDLEGLICSCAGASDTPLGNPVKDSLTGKIKDTTSTVIGVMYSPSSGPLAETAKQQVQEFAQWLESEGGASTVEWSVA